MGANLIEKATIGHDAALNKKASDVSILDIRGVSNSTDFVMVCSGDSSRQTQAIADEVLAKLREKGVRPIGIEGYETAKWILLDFSDIVVHVFHEETRKYYEIERLWEDAQKVEVNITQ